MKNKNISYMAIIVFVLFLCYGCTHLYDRPASRVPEIPSVISHAAPEMGYKESPTLEQQQPGLPNTANRLPTDPVLLPYQGKYSERLKLVRDDVQRKEYRAKYALYDDINLTIDQTSTVLGIQAALWEPVITAGSSTIEGNLFEEWRVESDGFTHLIRLREGLRWSDGTPVTAYDIRFALELFATDEPFLIMKTVYPSRTSQIWGLHGDIDGALPEIEIIDAFTCRITCAAKDPGLPVRAAYAPNGYHDILMPSALLSAFHIDYTPYKVVWRHMRELGLIPWPTDKQIEAARINGDPEPENPDPGESWAILFWQMLDQRLGGDIYRFHPWAKQIPTLSAWKLSDAFEGNISATIDLESFNGTSSIHLIRNPYYHKVDANKQQLPYYDVLEFGFYEGMLAGAQNNVPLTVGLSRYNVSEGSYSSTENDYSTRARDCNFHFLRLAQTANGDKWLENPFNLQAPFLALKKAIPGVETGFGLAMEFNDQKTEADWQAAIADPEFRKAVSSAIDRQEIIATVFNNHAQVPLWLSPPQPLPPKYINLETPILLQLQNYLPYSDYERLLDMLVEDLQLCGLGAYRMNEAESIAYHSGALHEKAPGIILTLTPSENIPSPFAAFPVPSGWNEYEKTTDEQAYIIAARSLDAKSIDGLIASWNAIRECVTDLQPYVPLVDAMDAYLYGEPTLQGNEGSTLLDQYHSIAYWWKSE